MNEATNEQPDYLSPRRMLASASSLRLCRRLACCPAAFHATCLRRDDTGTSNRSRCIVRRPQRKDLRFQATAWVLNASSDRTDDSIRSPYSTMIFRQSPELFHGLLSFWRLGYSYVSVENSTLRAFFSQPTTAYVIGVSSAAFPTPPDFPLTSEDYLQ
jgi:hypothetical protein